MRSVGWHICVEMYNVRRSRGREVRASNFNAPEYCSDTGGQSHPRKPLFIPTIHRLHYFLHPHPKLCYTTSAVTMFPHPTPPSPTAASRFARAHGHVLFSMSSVILLSEELFYLSFCCATSWNDSCQSGYERRHLRCQTSSVVGTGSGWVW